MCFYMFKHIFVSLHPHKATFAAVFYNVACVRTLYIGKTSKTLLFGVCSRFRVLYVCYRFWYVCSRLFLFPFSLAFCSTKNVRETLRKFLYVYVSLKCIFMQSTMVNRKLFGIFEFSQHLCGNVLSFYFLFLCFFSYFG